MIKLINILNEIQIDTQPWKKFHIGDKVEYKHENLRNIVRGVISEIRFFKWDDQEEDEISSPEMANEVVFTIIDPRTKKVLYYGPSYYINPDFIGDQDDDKEDHEHENQDFIENFKKIK